MALEQYCNDPGTTLASSATSSDSTVSVASSSGYPTTGNFRILIDTELLLVTAVSGTTWAVTRGIESTTPAGHSSGASVNQILTAGGLAQILLDRPQIYSGTGDPNGIPAEFAPHDLTSDSSHSPFVVAASSAYSLNPEYRAFDGATSMWIGTGGGTDWITLDLGFGNDQIMGSYSVQFGTGVTPRAPMDWTMQGSHNYSTWTTIDTVAGQTAWSVSEVRNFTVSVTTTAYRYFRYNVSANNGDANFIDVGELHYYTLAVPFSSGKDGDFYVDTISRKMYGPKSGSSW